MATFLLLASTTLVVSVVAAAILGQVVLHISWWNPLWWGMLAGFAGMFLVGGLVAAVVSAGLYQSSIDAHGYSSWRWPMVASVAGPALALIPGLALFGGMLGSSGALFVLAVFAVAVVVYFLILFLMWRHEAKAR